ncbi:hypothetical protein OQA88_1330 [Cercophora sp. LCS_1]
MTSPAQYPPRFRTDIYPFIHPAKYRSSLANQVTIITGAAGAIGQGLAESFAVAGTHLVLTYNNTPPPSSLEERCLRFGAASVTYFQCNVASLEGCESLIAQVKFIPYQCPSIGVFDEPRSEAYSTLYIPL